MIRSGPDEDPVFRFRYLVDEPIVSAEKWPRLGGNANGPSLIEAPEWLEDAPARFLLYFAHHCGQSIRLALSDDLAGPWRLHDPDPLSLAQSRFARNPPTESALDPEARAYMALGTDGDYPHIASPEAWVDDDRRQVRLYFHGRLENGLQRTRVALSTDGVHFIVRDEILSLPYLRIIRHRDWFYALAMPAQLYRSRDGLSAFEPGPRLTDEPIRHHAPFRLGERWYLVWSRVGDRPERLLISRLETDGDWHDWRIGPARELHRAHRSWEGGDLPAEISEYGAINRRANQLRDPAIFSRAGRLYVLYSVAGEQGIAIGEIEHG